MVANAIARLVVIANMEMKTRLLIVLTAIVMAVSALDWINQAYATCADVDYDLKLEESELAFTGTVTRLDNYDGPQKVTFFIHDVFKGEINTQKYIFENFGLVFVENDSISSSSTNVDYKIGKTYKVYIENGETDICTTKITVPPADYMWEPGPEDGNYYSEEEEIPLQQYQDANERPDYVDAKSSGSIVLPNEYPTLTDKQLDEMMDKLFDLELSHSELPIASIAIDYDRDILVLWTPDLAIGDKIKSIVGDTAFVLLYEEAPVRWTNDGPLPEPEQDRSIGDKCGPETVLQDGVCMVNSESESVDTTAKWEESFYEKLPPPNLKPTIDYDHELIYVMVLLTITIIGGIVGGIVFVVRRKRK